MSGVSDASDVNVWFVCVGEHSRLPLDQEIAFLRVTQGALANVANHSSAQRCEVVLTYEHDATTLVIADDDVGFDGASTARDPESGFGIAVMESRVAAIGGSLDIDTTPGNGTTVTTRIPVRTT